MIGVDVLAEQHDLAGAGCDEPPCLGFDVGGGSGILGPAGVGHDAEGAETVAPLLDREERRDSPPRLRAGQLLRQMVEARVRRHARIHGGAPRLGGASHHARQAVVGLGADDDIDEGRPRCDLFALGLRDAACDGEQHLAPGALARLFQRAQPAELGIDLFGRLLADVAGVEDDQIGVFERRRRAIAERCQDVRHAGGVVDIHLAAESLDVELFRHGLAVYRGLAGGRAARRSCRSPPRLCAADPSTRHHAVKRRCRAGAGGGCPSGNTEEYEGRSVDPPHIRDGEGADPPLQTFPAHGRDLVDHDAADPV